MSSNDNVKIARGFHDRTAHSPASVRTSGHTLAWDIKPFPFKVYAELPPIELPRTFDPLPADTLAALGAEPPARPVRLTLDAVAALLYFSAGVTKKKSYGAGADVLFRAAASTGALFQTEVYLVAGEVDGLAPGLYHFCPGDFALRRLREGDVRGPLAVAAADASIARRAATVVLSAIYWRNTWKYEARGYRHLFWDSGTMLANLLAASTTLGAAPRLLTGFVDHAVNDLLGVDANREAALELVALGPEGGDAPVIEDLPSIQHPLVPLSSEEVDYPLLREAYAASMLETPDAVHAWRGALAPRPRVPAGDLLALPAARPEADRALGETIQHRGSTRRFERVSISALELSTMLWWATRGFEADVPSGLVDLYLVLNAVEGFTAGAYRYWPGPHALERLSAGDYRNQSAFLCLEQPLGGDAAAVVYFLAPLDGILRAYGNRGYRLANLEAGIIGGRAYLGAYAQRLGASGLTFYDGEVVRFFSPAAVGHDAIFVTALGRSMPVRDAAPLLQVR